MQIIHSNRWGFRIHSPFVYNLVTRGLYGKWITAGQFLTFPENLNRHEKKTGMLTKRLICFFRPERITVTGSDRLNMWVAGHFRKEEIQESYTPGYIPFKCRQLVLIDGSHSEIQPVHTDDIWMITGLRFPLNRELWKKVTSIPEVTVSLETKDTGIVFFNPALPKKHYVITRWFYL